MRDGVRGFRTGEFFLRASDVLVAAAHGRFVQLKLLLQFGNFEDREKLPLRDVRSPIYVELLDVAGHLRVHIDFLVRLELGGNLEIAGRWPSLPPDDGDVRSVRGILGAHLARRSAASDGNGNDGERARSGGDRADVIEFSVDRGVIVSLGRNPHASRAAYFAFA